MTQRFYVYPLFVLAVFHLLPLLRLDWRWHTAQIAQWTLVILAGLGAIYFDRDIVWVYLAWTMFGVFRLAPDLLLRASSNRARLGHWRTAARTKRWAGRLLWGELGALHRGQAAALDLQANGATDQALAFLDELAARPLPAEARGAVHLWKLTLLAATRRWTQLVALYEDTDEWASLTTATAARLLAARAYAEN